VSLIFDKMKNMQKILISIKEYSRYFFALAVLVLVFLVNNAFPADVITSEACAGGKCPTALEEPQLTDKESFYFANDIFKSETKGYYRLTFQTKSTADSKIAIKITNPLDEDKKIKEIGITESKENKFQDILFATDDIIKYSDLLFEKINKNDGTEISITGIHIFKLNVTSEKEFANLKPTIKGATDYNVDLLEQTVNTEYFNQLKDPDIIFGQIFKAPADYITGVVLDLDIIKQSNIQGKKYDLDLRELDYAEGAPPEIRSITPASLSFSLADMDKYRQADGKYKFPLFAKVEKDKYYFIGLDNGKTNANRFNYLRLKGSTDGENFTDGALAVKNKGKTYSAAGDLYFKIFGIKFNEYNGIKILGGTVISDSGKDKGIFKYQPMGNIYDLANFNSYTSDISFDSDKKSFVGTTEDNSESNFTYKFETVFPFSKFHVFAKQPVINWGKTSILYSYDQENWQEIPSVEADEILPNEQKIEGIQTFDSTIFETMPKDTIYLKFQPKDPVSENTKWGISNFIFEAELTMR